MTTAYEVTHDSAEGPVTKRFGDLESAREYAQDKVFAGGPARLTVFEPEESKTRVSRKAEPEADEPPPQRRRR